VTTPAPATPGATATPTTAPTATPTAAATATPTTAPTVTPAATAQPTPGTDPLSRDLLFTDDFSDPASGWDTLNEPIASIDYDTGVLAFRFNQVGWAYTVRDLDAPVAVVRPVAQFIPGGDGIFGLMCGNSDGVFHAAVIGTDGGWVFARIDAAGVSVLARDDAAGIDVPVSDATGFGLQCTANDDGSLNMELVIPSLGPIAAHSVPDAGASSFGVVGLYGEALEAQFSMAVQGAAAFGVEATGQPSAGAQELLTHVPTEFQVGCAESPVPPLFTEPASFVVTCLLQTAGDGAELAEYVQFATKEDMDAAYQERVETFGAPSEGSCQAGPNETTWSINDVQLGRVQCGPQLKGVRYDWTDDRLNILSTLVDFDGDYAALYDQWLNAGPNE
jgi:hypothetical protein